MNTVWKIVLAFASAGLTVLALEALLRFVEGRPLRTVDGVVLWSTRSPRADRSDIERAAHDRTAFTIIGLGDSIMYGVSEPKDKTYLEHARRVLAQHSNHRVEIINLAVPGFNTVQENAVYKEIEDQLTPSLVLVHFTPNDTQQSVSDGAYVYDTRALPDDSPLTAFPFAARLSNFLLSRSRLYDQLYALALRNRIDWSSLKDPPGGAARMCSALTEIQERARQAGARLLVLSSAELKRPLSNELPEALRQCASPRGIEVINLTEWLGGAEADGIALDSVHFNEEGHRRIGEALAAYLLAHDLRE